MFNLQENLKKFAGEKTVIAKMAFYKVNLF